MGKALGATVGRSLLLLAACAPLLLLVAGQVPADEEPPAGQPESLRLPLALRHTSSQAIDTAVLHEDRWLPSHQSLDGRWSAADYDRWCRGARIDRVRRLPGRGDADYDVAVTGSVLCAFLNAGYTHRGKHPIARTVLRGLRWLRDQQDTDGCFGSRGHPKFLHGHALATLAMTEAYGMTGSMLWESSARRSVAFLLRMRNEDGVWSYRSADGRDDPMATFWAMLPVKNAELIQKDARKRNRRNPFPGIAATPALQGIRPWLDRHTDAATGRFVPHEASAAHGDALPATAASHAATAGAVLTRVFMGSDPRKEEIIQRAAAFLAQHPPSWDPDGGGIDQTYWYFGTLAMFQVGGRLYDGWKRALEAAVVDTQHRRGDYCDLKGSWDPHGPWARDLGRVYSTALMALCMDVFYRYDRVFGAKDDGQAPAPVRRPARTWQRSNLAAHAGRVRLHQDGDLPIEAERIAVEIHGPRARVVLDLYVRNDRKTTQEGRFQLRLPEGAVPYYLAFGDLELERAPPFDPAVAVRTEATALSERRTGKWGRVREARMVPVVRGGQAYREVVQRTVTRDPALLQWVGGGVFDVSVYPLFARQLHRIVLGYEIDLTPIGADYEYRLDLPADIADLDVAMEVRTAGAQVSPAGVTVGEVHHWRNPATAEIRVRVPAPRTVLLQGRDTAAREHFAIWTRPDLPDPQPCAARDHAVFLVDVSESAGRGHAAVWPKLLRAVLEGNRDTLRRFSVGFFDLRTHWWRGGLVANTPRNVDALVQHAESLPLEGATDLGAALRAASRLRGGFDLFLLSDGATNWAPRDLDALGRALGPGRPVYGYTTGIPGVDRRLLEHLARETGGALFTVTGESEIAAAARAHRLRPWRLLEASVSGSEDLLVAERPAVLYPGQRLRLAGRGNPPSDATVHLRLCRDGATRSLELPVDQRVDSDMAADVYGAVAVTQLESFEDRAAAVAEAYAAHYRVVGRTCSLLMLEEEGDYLRAGLPPGQSAKEVLDRPARHAVERAALESAPSHASSPRGLLLSLLASISAEQSVAFELPRRLMDTIRTVPLRELAVVPRPLRPGHEADALRKLSTLREREPGSIELAREMAQVARTSGYPSHAYRLLLEVARLRPTEPSTFWTLAACAAEMRHDELALIWYEVALAGRWRALSGDRTEIVAQDYVRFLRRTLRAGGRNAMADFAADRLESLGLDWHREADLVVLLDWSTDATDLNLQVTDPWGRVYNPEGDAPSPRGHMSSDALRGFGPEMFVAERALDGAYTIEVERRLSTNFRTPKRTRAQVLIVRDWGRPTERVLRRTVLFTEPKGHTRVTCVGR